MPANGSQGERRSRPRRRVLYLRCHSPMPGEIVNLSEHGMAIETLIELPQDHELTFRLRPNSETLELKGWIRWCRPTRTISTSEGRELKLYHSGVEFNTATIETVSRCAEVLQLAGETEDGARHGVLKVRAPG